MRRTAVLAAAAGLALLAAALLGATLATGADPSGAKAAPPPDAAEAGDETDPLGPNGACYVCHTTFVKEDLAKVHLKAKIACTKCHGLSDKHANDENIGATKPDIVIQREKIDASCQECHETHDARAKKVLARFHERKLTAASPVCTDCHGAHKIERAAEESK